MKGAGALGNLALAGLLIVDIGMVALVVQHQKAGTVVDRTATPTATATGRSTVTSTGRSTATATATDTGSGVKLASALLSVVDAKTAWLGEKGSCAEGGGRVSVTTDGGATWAKTASQPYRALSRIDATSATAGFVVGAGPSCAVAVRSTSNGGKTWRAAASVDRSWAIDLRDPKTLHSTSGSTSTPCDTAGVLALARSSDADATVLCDDGRTRRTTNAGEIWSAGPRLPEADTAPSVLGLTIVGTGADARVAVAVEQAECAGVAVLTARRTGLFTTVACVKATASSSAPAALTTQVDKVGTAWLLVDTTLWRSTGDLSVWTRTS